MGKQFKLKKVAVVILISLLLFSFKYLNTNEKEKQLFNAISNGNINQIELLLNEGFNINCKDKYGSTPLHCAVIFNKKEIVKLLIKRGANPNIQNDTEGYTPLHNSVFYGEEEIIKALILNKAEIEKYPFG